jgi:hypothetical protein
MPRLLLLVSCLALSACGSLLSETTSDVAGIAGAGAAGSVTKNAAVATGIGLGVRAGAMAGLRAVERRVHKEEQNAIAAAAGNVEEGQVGVWHSSHLVPIEANEHGEVVVTRSFGGAGFRCKEIIFSVDQEKTRSFYMTDICLDGTTWRWATADPATERWGALQ